MWNFGIPNSFTMEVEVYYVLQEVNYIFIQTLISNYVDDIILCFPSNLPAIFLDTKYIYIYIYIYSIKNNSNTSFSCEYTRFECNLHQY